MITKLSKKFVLDKERFHISEDQKNIFLYLNNGILIISFDIDLYYRFLTRNDYSTYIFLKDNDVEHIGFTEFNSKTILGFSSYDELIERIDNMKKSQRVRRDK